MKFKFKFLAAMAVLVLSTITMNAQADGAEKHRGHKERAEKRMAKTIEKLGLSEEQTVELKVIHKAYIEKSKAAKAQITSREEMAEFRHNNHLAKVAEIKRLLTPEQYEIFDTIDPNRKGKKGKRGKKGRKGKKGAKEFQKKSKL